MKLYSMKIEKLYLEKEISSIADFFKLRVLYQFNNITKICTTGIENAKIEKFLLVKF